MSCIRIFQPIRYRYFFFRNKVNPFISFDWFENLSNKIWHSLVNSFGMYEFKNYFILFYGHCKMLKCSFRLSGFLFRCLYHGNTGCRVFKRGVHNWEDFCLKINIPKGNYWILRIGVMGRCQKMPKFDFQSQFSTSKIIRIFLNFFFIEEYVIDIFW